MKTTPFRVSMILSLTVLTAGIFLLPGCEKNKELLSETKTAPAITAESNALPEQAMTRDLTIAHISEEATGNRAMFCENAQPLAIPDADILKVLKQAFAVRQKVKVKYDPWKASIESIEILNSRVQTAVRNEGVSFDLGSTSVADLDDAGRLGTINTTFPALTNVIPDFATAQLMFTYITKQCCAVPGPYEIDYCIPFQYAYDGCYARAHKMCWILNNKYHYSTHKIFSFANSGPDVLSVQGQKWGGCCINWWYHVAPLVNVNTPTGVKAYVFDPAMFNQPVLLSVWLHAQENPVCSGAADVSMINIQPTTSFWPADYSGYAFDPDPTYAYTNYYLNYYGPMTTCP